MRSVPKKKLQLRAEEFNGLLRIRLHNESYKLDSFSIKRFLMYLFRLWSTRKSHYTKLRFCKTECVVCANKLDTMIAQIYGLRTCRKLHSNKKLCLFRLRPKQIEKMIGFTCAKVNVEAIRILTNFLSTRDDIYCVYLLVVIVLDA